MHRSVAVGVVGLLLASSVLVGATATAGIAATGTAAATDTAAADTPLLAQPEGFDETSFIIEVYENQSARWTFEHRRALANDTEAQQFRDFADQFESTESDLYRNFVNRSRSLVAVGTNATGREMTAVGHTRSASIQELGQRQGVVRLSFTWTNFAQRTDDSVVIGDVFDGGIPIGENQRLVVQHGPNLTFGAALPDDYSADGETLADSDSLTWFGERRFADEQPRVEFHTQGAGSQSSPVDSTPADSDEETNPVMFVGLLLIVAVLATGLAYKRGLFDGLRSTNDSGDGGSAASSEGATPGSGTAPAEPEIVSDRDRVTTLLSDNGGRMKQVRIVEETEWSKSKVSMLLSEMEEDGEISKLRVGRENIISLSGHEPDAAGSPFDDE